MVEKSGEEKVSQVPQIETLSNSGAQLVINPPVAGVGVVGGGGYPKAYLDFREAHPDYFKYNDGSVIPLENGYKTWQVINQKSIEGELERKGKLKELDAAIEAKNKAAAEDKEWKELVVPRKVVITQRMRELFRVHHENAALAHVLNENYGTEAEGKGEIRFDMDKLAWMVFNGEYWVEDPSAVFVIGLAERFLFDAVIEASVLHDSSLSKQLVDTQSHGSVKAALGFLKAMVAVNTEMFDTDPNLINLKNGTYNVATGELSSYRKSDYITRVAGVEFDPKATCPKWLSHLEMVIPDASTRLAFQVFMGHCLIAGNPQNAAMFAYGTGKNGKTVTFSTIDHVLGMYAHGASAATFTERFNDDGPRPDLARMKGARLITVPEGKQGRKLDEGIFKNLTGGSDDVTARFLYGREFCFKPTAKLVFHTNHLPKITGRDNGIWRRIYPIPFTTVVPEESRIPDYDKVLYSTEGSGILNWLIIGYKYYKIWGGLIYTKQIDEARVLYKDKEDVLGDFFDHYKITGDDKDQVNRADLYKAYKDWCNFDCANEKPFNKNKFNDMVEERVGSPKRSADGSKWMWHGIKAPNYSITASK